MRTSAAATGLHAGAQEPTGASRRSLALEQAYQERVGPSVADVVTGWAEGQRGRR